MAGTFTAKYKDFIREGSEDVWIETGTYRGHGVEAALKFGFHEIYTIEVSQPNFQSLSSALSTNPKVFRYLGSSRDVLPKIIESVTTRDAVFWLDGHYQGESAAEQDSVSECPLLDELKTIARTGWRRSVLVCIDDAYLFDEAYWISGAMRHKFDAQDWPRQDQIASIMQGWKSHREDDILYFHKDFQ